MVEIAAPPNHQPPPVAAPQAAPPAPHHLAVSRGPTWTPVEQLQHLHYCIHSNPSWRKHLSFFLHHLLLLVELSLINLCEINLQLKRSCLVSSTIL